MTSPSIPVHFVTTNSMKFDIARAYFEPLGDSFELKQYAIELPEIQAETVEEVAAHSAREAVKRIGEACVVSDAGLCIEALNGFPGPFLKYANEQLGVAGYLNLLRDETNARAYFEDALVIAFPDGSIRSFIRRNYGVIAKESNDAHPRWPANSLFIPDGYDVPLGELRHEEQVAFWGAGSWPDIVTCLREYADSDKEQR